MREAGLAVRCWCDGARSWHEKVTGIDSGADDYLASLPHGELLARLRASSGAQPASHPTEVWRPGPGRASGKGNRGWRRRTIDQHEFRVLSYLMHHSDRVVSQGELTEHIYARALSAIRTRLKSSSPACGGNWAWFH